VDDSQLWWQRVRLCERLGCSSTLDEEFSGVLKNEIVG